MPTNDGFQAGVSNCYVFKSRLQEYAQKIGLPTPVYDTIKEGPSHEPSFRSTVIVNDVRYDSLPGFFNRKAAEQSAAEVALFELFKSGEVNQSISQPVHETGLCKNLLQEYAQKMNYAIPVYQCQKDETPGRLLLFSCTVEIGGIRYIGAAARTKKEAEIKAARTALLAIQSSASQSSEKPFGNSQLTVIPCKKRGTESVINTEEAANVPKAKKTRFKKKMLKKKLPRDKAGYSLVENAVKMEFFMDNCSEPNQTDVPRNQEASLGTLAMEAMRNSQDGRSDVNSSEKEIFGGEVALAHRVNGNSENGKSTASYSNPSNNGNPDAGTSSVFSGDMTVSTKDVIGVFGVEEVASVADNSTMGQIEASTILPA
ncbi:double-stranded RNA-binding protein 1-like isoform X3 [Corylus avellana]|uniref:double-stranded RNA-binding protein 1-like isoform X3 n=1 Tax=Corylus avellana TaxID=13451 RepID=UPI00286C4DB5|nr:double-stranded RNA-binding protein 1-like isoform X3 [Corylus avellana]